MYYAAAKSVLWKVHFFVISIVVSSMFSLFFTIFFPPYIIYLSKFFFMIRRALGGIDRDRAYDFIEENSYFLH